MQWSEGAADRVDDRERKEGASTETSPGQEQGSQGSLRGILMDAVEADETEESVVERDDEGDRESALCRVPGTSLLQER